LGVPDPEVDGHLPFSETRRFVIVPGKPATGPCTELDRPIPHYHTIFRMNFNIM